MVNNQNDKIQQVLDRVQDDNIEFIRMEFLDYTGVTRGRTIRNDNLRAAMEDGVNFSTAIMSFDMFDEFIEGGAYGSNDGDFFAIPDPDTYAVVPFREKTARMLCDLYDVNGEPWEGCPRNALKRLLEKVEKLLGGKLNMAYEQEAYLLDTDEKGNILPADQSHCFSTDGVDIQDSFVQSFVHALETMGVTTEQISSEYGPGQLELNLKYADALKATDDQVTFTHLFKQIARQHDMLGTLMAKPFEDQPGSGLHVHISLYDEDGNNLFEDPSDKRGLQLSQNAYYFIGGLLKHGRSLVGIGAPTFNSYKRMQPGSWAPAHVCYGDANRSVLVRVPEVRRARRFEFRGADGSCNPYLLSTCLLAAGLDGIQNKIDPGDPMQEDVAEFDNEQLKEHGIEWVPRDLLEAVQTIEKDAVLGETIGQSIWKEFMNVKRSEWRKYTQHISGWELESISKIF